MSTRSRFSLAFLALAATLAISGCRKEQVQTTTHTDSANSVVTSAPAAVVDSAANATNTSSSSNPSSKEDTGAAVFSSRILDDNDPIAKQLVESMKHPENPKMRINPNPGMPIELIDPSRLAALQPKLPGYQMVGQPSGSQNPSFSKSTAIYKSLFDSTHSIRVLILDENEQAAAPFQQQIQQLQQKGSITSAPNGTPITAYYVQVNGAPAAKAYVADKKLASLSVLVSGHRLIQMRETPATNADHLVEIAKNLDVRKFEALK